MKRALATTAISVLCLLGAAPTAFAASPSQRECEAAGGTFDRTNGEVSCVYPVVSDPVGNSERSGGKSQTVDTQETESSQGTLNNKPKYDKDESCSGPGNSSSGC